MTIFTVILDLLILLTVATCGALFFGVLPIVIVDSLEKRKGGSEEWTLNIQDYP